MHRQIMAFPLHMHSGFPMEKVEQMIMMSSNDITVICHAIGGGKYIRKASSELSSGFLALNSWSFVKSLTLYSGYIGASCGEIVYPG